MTVFEKKLDAQPEPQNLETQRPKPRDAGISSPVIPGTLERLPWQLEHLIRAATNETLPASAKLETGIVPDLNRYVMACACAYLTGNQDALTPLWHAHATWHASVERTMN